MKKSKKFLASLLAMTLSTGLFVGCGSKTEEPQNTNTTTSTTTETNGVVQIEFWHSLTGQIATVLDGLVANFNSSIGQEKNIEVKTVFQAWPGTDKLATVMQTGNLEEHPDLIQIYGENLNMVRNYEHMAWVEDFITREDSQIKKEDLVPNAMQAFSVNDKMLGAPLTLSTLLLYYNKDMFDAANIQAPPTTIAEMAEMIPQLTKKTGDTTDVYGLNLSPDTYEMNSFISSQGEYSFFGDNESGRSGPMTKIIAGENGTLDKFLTEWEKVIQSGGYKHLVDNMNEEFANEKHAMVIMSSARINLIQGLVGDKFNWGVAHLPKVDAQDQGGSSVSGGGLFMINKGNEAKLDASWEFIQYCLSPEAQLYWMQNTGYVPVNANTYELEETKAYLETQEALNIAIEQVLASNPKVQEPYMPNATAIKTVVKETMILFAEGKLTAEQARDEIVQKGNNLINDYYRSNPID